MWLEEPTCECFGIHASATASHPEMLLDGKLTRCRLQRHGNIPAAATTACTLDCGQSACQKARCLRAVSCGSCCCTKACGSCTTLCAGSVGCAPCILADACGTTAYTEGASTDCANSEITVHQADESSPRTLPELVYHLLTVQSASPSWSGWLATPPASSAHPHQTACRPHTHFTAFKTDSLGGMCAAEH